MHWAEPGWFLLFVIAPLPWLFARSRSRMAWPTLTGFSANRPRRAAILAGLPPLLRVLALGSLFAALARPQSVGGRTRIAAQGVAIVAALDHSSSMNAVDFSGSPSPLSRLDAAKKTFARFVEGRPDDLIGLICFANYPDRACPPTLDHRFLLDTVRALRSARAGDDGTNIGYAIAMAVDVLRTATPSKKVLILLTDGQDRPAVPQPLDPEVAAHMARELGVTLHTIAIGQPGGIVREVEPETQLNLVAQVEPPDVALLERLARIGGGRAFVATDAKALAQVFATIDALEKSPVQGDVRTLYREEYAPWVAAALGFLLLDCLLSSGKLRRLP